MPVISGRTTKTAYLDLFDNGISANVVLFVDRFKLQLPKWVFRDFLSLAAVMYPDAPINRRENPERVLVEDVMTERLGVAGFRYNPGRTHTHLPESRTDPNAAFESMMTTPAPATRADLARAGSIDKMFQMIISDIKQAEQGGADVCATHGWTNFEVAIVRHVLKLHADRKAKQ